jgi:hypothetical protein
LFGKRLEKAFKHFYNEKESETALASQELEEIKDKKHDDNPDHS